MIDIEIIEIEGDPMRYKEFSEDIIISIYKSYEKNISSSKHFYMFHLSTCKIIPQLLK